MGSSGRGEALTVEGRPVRVSICGVRPALDVPLAWLHAHLHHPDIFLYVVLHVP